MEFYSFKFVLFVILSLIFHDIIGRIKSDKQWIAKLIISVFYYSIISKWGVVYIMLTSVLVYLGSIGISDIEQKARNASKNRDVSKEESRALKQKSQTKKKTVLTVIICLNILVIILFKINAIGNYVNILAPLGISFYTFMAISYIVDVYGNKYECEDNYFKLLLYLVWFPQLLQGPINRYDSQKETLYKKSDLAWDTVKYALFLLLFGALKKYALANPLSGPVDKIFDGDFGNKPGAYLGVGALLFAIQQYADFSGGIDMMLAVSMLFGVTMSDNFKQPYFSRSIGEFWRRWHISLGSFMRDYVFYPFTFSFPVRKLMNRLNSKYGSFVTRSIVGGVGNIIVFVLVGAWHGLSLHYILWGLYNGIIIAVSEALNPVYKKVKKVAHVKDSSRVYHLFQITRTFILIVLAGYFDRIVNVSDSITCFKNTFIHFEPALSKVWLSKLYEWEVITDAKIMFVIIILFIIIIDSTLREMNKNGGIYESLKNKSIILRWGTVYIMIILLMASFIFSKGSIGFMYEQF